MHLNKKKAKKYDAYETIARERKFAWGNRQVFVLCRMSASLSCASITLCLSIHAAAVSADASNEPN